jgi:hypothetical protein
MKQLWSIVILIGLFLWWGWFLWFSQVESAQADTSIQMQQSLSRYEMIRLVAESNCQDCLRPPLSWKQKYSSSRLVDFKSLLRNYVDDIDHEQARFNDQSYYYCVAHAGDQGWINGFPRLSVGLCQGKFCGENTARGTELVQMISNMIAPKIWKNYPLSFQTIKNRSLASGVLNDIESIGLINKGLGRCGDKSCAAESLEEFQIYMKYCAHHLEDCNMRTIPPFVQWQWPIAELNILYNANIIAFDDPMIARLGSVITMSDFERFLPALKQVTSCISLADYDGDRLPNDRDNCPDHYNPRQHNLDKDTFWDVCDEDIDGDGALNDKNLVNDEGVLLKQQMSGRDDCPLISVEQMWGKDCTTVMQQSLLAFDIQANPVVALAWEPVNFRSELVGNVSSLAWDFGDGQLGNGVAPSHSYLSPGSYHVVSYAQGINGQQLQSHAQVLVKGEDTPTALGVAQTELRCENLTGTLQTDFRCFLRVEDIDLWNATMLRWHWGDGEIQDFSDAIDTALLQNHRYKKPGTYTIMTQLFFGLEELITQQLVVYVTGESFCLSWTTACDADNDSIPDQCDADIDGDGVTNIIGIINKDLPNCGFSLENIDTTILRDQIDAIKKWVVYDNCSFVRNQSQEDEDLDAIGNVCDTKDLQEGSWSWETMQPLLPEDRDGDGILDDRDACEDIPENMNGIEDKDGCPELPKSCKPGSKCSGKAPACTTCPCPWADFASELWKGDRVRAVLMDEAGQVIYRYSPAEVIDVTIPDKMLGK